MSRMLNALRDCMFSISVSVSSVRPSKRVMTNLTVVWLSGIFRSIDPIVGKLLITAQTPSKHARSEQNAYERDPKWTIRMGNAERYMGKRSPMAVVYYAIKCLQRHCRRRRTNSFDRETFARKAYGI